MNWCLLCLHLPLHVLLYSEFCIILSPRVTKAKSVTHLLHADRMDLGFPLCRRAGSAAYSEVLIIPTEFRSHNFHHFGIFNFRERCPWSFGESHGGYNYAGRIHQ